MTCYQCGRDIHEGHGYFQSFHEIRPVTLIKGNKQITRLILAPAREVQFCIRCADLDAAPDCMDKPFETGPEGAA